MRAILLAAGLGTRLRPLTDATPKCLMRINGVSLLGIWMERLIHSGVSPLLVNTHYLSDQVSEFVKKSDFKDQVDLVHEPSLLGTAGTLMENLDFFRGEDGMLIHADNYCMANLTHFIQTHLQRPPSCLMTMMTFRTNAPSDCGIVEIDNSGVVIGFHEKVASPPGNLANGAVYILSAALIKHLKFLPIIPKDFSTEVVSNLIGRIYTYETSEDFIDIGTPASYALANKLNLKINIG
jgi:mannose-1-phosphate guanylyltransferase